MGPVLEENFLYSFLYQLVENLLPSSLSWMAYLVAGLMLTLLIVNGIMVLAMVFMYMERRVLGRFQSRVGPNRVGPFGLLQPIADAIKLLFKEDLIPDQADRTVFNLAPLVMIVPALLILSVIPFGENFFLIDINVGLLFLLAVTSISSLAVFMAGWSSGNRYAMLGSVRGVAQLISYEVPMVLSVVGILLLAGSLSLVDIVEAQRIPFLALQPLGFFVFISGASAELNRSPFDTIEAESEIIAGYHIEYSGMKFGIMQLAEFAGVVILAATLSTLFLKGWEGPFLPSPVWFLLKVFFFLFIMIWIRATLPRLRIDQIMNFAWKVLFPLSILNIFVTAIEVLLWDNPTLLQLWAMAAANWAIAIVAILLLSILMGKRLQKPSRTVIYET